MVLMRFDIVQRKQKIIHIDMDCFYAAVEIRDNPKLSSQPVAVGGSGERGVLCTCNYLARSYGVRSAMSNKIALQKCPDLLILPVNMAKYKDVSKSIQQIFYEFSDLVEPLSLDEAYIDVTDNQYFSNSATLIADEIRRQIWQKENLTASAGVAPNKFLAKIASGWNKPNGLFVIPPENVEKFVLDLEVNKLFGVGRVTAEKLHKMNINTCNDLQKFALPDLIHRFGKFGHVLYLQSRGIDNRLVNANRVRKSVSVETTFLSDTNDIIFLNNELNLLYGDLTNRYTKLSKQYQIKGLYVKVKYKDFKSRTAEMIGSNLDKDKFLLLLQKLMNNVDIRLLGLGVKLLLNDDKLNSELLFDFTD